MINYFETLLASSKTLIMGILNITPDSFSGDGVLQTQLSFDKMQKYLEKIVQAGCHILDIGAESTRPGSQGVTLDEEMERFSPILEYIIKQSPVPVSIDTRKAVIANLALEYGAVMVNDISSFQDDELMLPLLVQKQSYCVVMHRGVTNSTPSVDKILGASFFESSHEPNKSITCVVYDALKTHTQHVINAGINPKKIIIDLGFGFNKTPQENLTLLANLDFFKTLPFPMLLGVSRKSMIGHVTQATVDHRLGGSLACLTYGILKGVKIVRVHDYFDSAQAALMVDTLKHIPQEPLSFFEEGYA